MADTVRADPELLCQAGNALAGHGEALLALQLCGDSDVAAAPSGWAGSSAGALTELLDSWADSTRCQAGRLVEHACGLRMTAEAFHEQRQASVLGNVVA